MAEEKEVQELMNQLKLVKEEVAQIKKRLATVGKEKEKWFAKKKEVSNQIRDKISGVRGSKVERNTLTKDARQAKNERDRLNGLIADKIKDIKTMKKSYSSTAAKQGIKGNPSALKQSIEKMEYRLQTEPMGFDKEQKLMKELKVLTKQYASFKAVSKEWDAVAKKSKEIDELKEKANEYHRQVQNYAKSSQQQHEVVISDSKEIDDLKKAEEDAYEQFFKEKTKFKDINAELKKKLAELQEIKDNLESHNVALQEEEHKKQQLTLKEKAAVVQDKIKQKKKLTTEDLLIMQRSGK